jgi:hypothetical protein
MNKPLLLALVLLAVCATAAFAGGEKEAAAGAKAESAEELAGRKRIMINPPELTGFPEIDASVLSNNVQNTLDRNFANYAGMTVATFEDMPNYILDIEIQRHSSTLFTITLKVKDAGSLDILATSKSHSAPSLDLLKFGPALNLATKDILDDRNLGIKLSPDASRALEKAVDTKLAEAADAKTKANAAPQSSFRREQNTNVAEALGQTLTKAELELSETANAGFTPPEFSAPEFTAVTFKPPVVRVLSTSRTVEGMQADIARYREIQAANKAAVEDQQQYLLGQRKAILDQWQDFLGEVEARRQLLRAEEEKLSQVQERLEAELHEGEEYYRVSPPFRIIYDPNPEQEIDFVTETADFRFNIASEPTSIKALKLRLDNLTELNKGFTRVNKAYEDVNAAMATRRAQVEAAMDAVKKAMDNANAAGQELRQDYQVAPVSTTSPEWDIPPGESAHGRALRTSWPVDYPRTFELTVNLLAVRDEDDVEVIESKTLSLVNDISWNGLLKPEAVSLRGAFNDVNIERLGEEGSIVVLVESVNGIDAETAALTGYIEIIPDKARTAATGRQITARDSWRSYWTDPNHLNSLGVAVGTAFATPAFLASARLTFSPFRYGFFEAGSDFGLVHGEKDVNNVEYLSFAPYLHYNLFGVGDGVGKGNDGFGLYIGAGGGMSLSRYTYPSESHVDPVIVNTMVFDFNLGTLWTFSHSVIDLRWTIKTNFKTGVDHRLTLGYIYRFGYFARRNGGNPADLINRR